MAIFCFADRPPVIQSYNSHIDKVLEGDKKEGDQLVANGKRVSGVWAACCCWWWWWECLGGRLDTRSAVGRPATPRNPITLWWIPLPLLQPGAPPMFVSSLLHSNLIHCESPPRCNPSLQRSRNHEERKDGQRGFHIVLKIHRICWVVGTEGNIGGCAPPPLPLL